MSAATTGAALLVAAALLVGRPFPPTRRVVGVVRPATAGSDAQERHLAAPGPSLLPHTGGKPTPREPPSRLPTAVVLVVGWLVVGWLLGGPVLGGVGALVLVAAQHELSTRARARAQERRRRAVVELCGSVMAELHVGRLPEEALSLAVRELAGREAGVVSDPALAEVLRPLSGGGDADAAAVLIEASQVPGADALRRLAICWQVSATTGAGLADAVRAVVDGLAADAALDREVDNQLAGPRSTAALLTVLPLGGVLLGAGLGADLPQILLHTPLGALCLFAGLGLVLAGRAWTTAIVSSAAS